MGLKIKYRRQAGRVNTDQQQGNDGRLFYVSAIHDTKTQWVESIKVWFFCICQCLTCWQFCLRQCDTKQMDMRLFLRESGGFLMKELARDQNTRASQGVDHRIVRQQLSNKNMTKKEKSYNLHNKWGRKEQWHLYQVIKRWKTIWIGIQLPFVPSSSLMQDKWCCRQQKESPKIWPC